MKRIGAFLIVLITISASCRKPSGRLDNGIWRATVKTETGTEIPFNFEVADSAGKKYVYILNGSDRFRIDEVITKKDSVNLIFPLFNAEIRSVFGHNGYLYGKFIRHLEGRDVSMDFNAQPNIKWRFFNTKLKSKYPVNGRWSATFSSLDGKDTTVAVGEFVQKDAHVTGTFLTRSGDYRFLQGALSDNKLYLSTFDGSNSLMFTGELVNDNTITNGKFYSGFSTVKNWSARKDEKAMLPDSYSLTQLKPGRSAIDFSFPNLRKEPVSINDERFKDKIVVVQLFGSWCPNCMDEMAYLSSFYKKYRTRGVEIIGLGYETSRDFGKSKRNIERLKNRLNVDYELLVTGYTNKKDEVLKSLPALSTFIAFPTLIIVDKKGAVRKIHTGFTGPGTGSHYVDFINQFERTIEDLLNE